LIRSGPLDPALNLALDEAMLRSGTETLRLYAWDPPGLSLGFFQQAGEFRGRDEFSGFTLVRRPTGGGAIAHTGELTVAWVGQRQRVDRVYESINAVVAAAVRSLGVEASRGEGEPRAAPRGLCFDAHTRYDLLAAGRKFFGSAQRRGRGRFLLHGTLVLEPNRWARGAISLRELIGRVVTRGEAEAALAEAAGRLWGTALHAEAPTADEWRDAERLVSRRYGNEEWTARR
jgi:lipoate-protein ligase A